MAKKTGDDIAIASDHAAFDLKQHLLKYLLKKGYAVIDMGTRNRKSVDYPAYAHKLARSVSSGEVSSGILLCGTGIGTSIAANRHAGVRAALVHDIFTARMAKAHNNANILVLGGRILAPHYAEILVDTWLETEYEGGRHQRRLDMIDEE
ncbi:MAG: ribose 5-phosphate isomerase B [bacterium]